MSSCIVCGLSKTQYYEDLCRKRRVDDPSKLPIEAPPWDDEERCPVCHNAYMVVWHERKRQRAGKTKTVTPGDVYRATAEKRKPPKARPDKPPTKAEKKGKKARKK